MKIKTKFGIRQSVYYANKANHAVLCKHCDNFLCFHTYTPIIATIKKVTIDENGLSYMITLYEDIDHQGIKEEELFKSAAAAIKGCEKLNWEARK